VKSILETTQGMDFHGTDVMKAHAHRDGLLGFKQDLQEAKRLYFLIILIFIIYF
jgi:hypothetical protein